MTERECPHCGAMMNPAAPCPVCELSVGAVAAPRATVDGDHDGLTGLARWWHNGRLAVAISALCFAVSTFVPLVTGVTLLSQGERMTVSVSLWQLASGVYPVLKGRASAWFVPAVAMFLLSLLRSRRTGPSMRATRPLLFSLSLAPLVGAVLPLARLHRQSVSPGAGVGLVFIGVAFCVVAAFRFGRDEPDAPRSRLLQDPDDD